MSEKFTVDAAGDVTTPTARPSDAVIERFASATIEDNPFAAGHHDGPLSEESRLALGVAFVAYSHALSNLCRVARDVPGIGLMGLSGGMTAFADNVCQAGLLDEIVGGL